MRKVKIITDSNSGILQSEAKELGIFVIPMPFTVNMEEYLEEISITQDEFYEKLAMDADVTTSQPSRYYLEELWEENLKDAEEILYIPMTSGLSKTCENAMNYAEKFNGKVQVVDNKRISVVLKSSIFEAIKYAEQGLSAKEIKEKNNIVIVNKIDLENKLNLNEFEIQELSDNLNRKQSEINNIIDLIDESNTRILEIESLVDSIDKTHERMAEIIEFLSDKKEYGEDGSVLNTRPGFFSRVEELENTINNINLSEYAKETSVIEYYAAVENAINIYEDVVHDVEENKNIIEEIEIN